MRYLNYILGAILSIPLLPLMYYQGKKIRASVPKLPEATGNEGKCIAIDNERSLQFLFMGESTMAGVGVSTHKEGFAGSFAQSFSQLAAVNVDWKVYAKSGATAKDLTENIIPRISETNADLIVIALGANDAFRLNPPWRWRKEIIQLIKRLQVKFPDAQIVFCNMPPIKDFPAFTPLIKTVVGNLVILLGKELQSLVHADNNVFYYDEHITLEQWIAKFNLQNKREAFFSDGVHPSKLTYQIWARDVANEVYKRLWKSH